MPRDRRNDWEPHFVIGQTSASWIVHPQTDGAPTDWSAVKVIKATMRTAAAPKRSARASHRLAELRLLARQLHLGGYAGESRERLSGRLLQRIKRRKELW